MKEILQTLIRNYLSRFMRKPDFCICENKDADQCLCFRYMDSTIPLLPKSEISSLQPSSVAVQPGLCRTWSETPKTSFLTTRLIYKKEKNILFCTNNHCIEQKKEKHHTVSSENFNFRDVKITAYCMVSWEHR